MLSSWELREPPPDDTTEPSEHGSDPDTELEDLRPHECSQRFFDMLVDLKLSGKLGAKAVCILSFWARGQG
eukprot:16434170-Heterocapsa_arctica.AAC.1